MYPFFSLRKTNRFSFFFLRAKFHLWVLVLFFKKFWLENSAFLEVGVSYFFSPRENMPVPTRSFFGSKIFCGEKKRETLTSKIFEP